MKQTKLYVSVILVLFCFQQCQKDVNASETALPVYDSIPLVKKLNPQLNEVSGIADSKANPGHLWGHEDSGNPPKVHLIKHDGNVVKSIYLKGISNRDWEDMALARDTIYIAEAGDNTQSYSEYKFYCFAEPSASIDTVSQVRTIRFTYPDGSHDCEAFLIDPSSNDIYIITKRDNPSKIYRLHYPFALQNTASYVGDLPYAGVVGAAISPDGKNVIIKTYFGLNNYIKMGNETIGQTLQKTYSSLPYTFEPQGEAVTFALNNGGYFTLSEKGLGGSVNLFFYQRK